MKKQFEIKPEWIYKKIRGSSQITLIAWSSDEKRLYVEFYNGNIYSYSPCTFDKFKEFAEASSVGKYFHTHIKQLETTKISNGKTKD